MNIKPIWAALAFIAPITLLADSAELVSFSGESQSQTGPNDTITYSGQATALIAGQEEMRVSAAAISFDPLAHTMVCTGGVAVTSGGHSIQADKLTITLKADKIYLFNPAGAKPVSEKRLRDGHSLYVPATSWKPDQAADALFQSSAPGAGDRLDSGLVRTALTLPVGK